MGLSPAPSSWRTRYARAPTSCSPICARSALERILLATGDRRDVAEAVGSGLSLDGIRSELTPDEKVAVVQEERKRGPVMMIGDGVNDAPARARPTSASP